MAMQAGWSVLDCIILTVLERADEYGYSLTQYAQRLLSISESTMYPALKRLQKGALVTTYDSPFQGRMRRYYSLTQEGRQTLARYREEWVSYKVMMDDILKEDIRHG